jgi:hypothetical protein
MGNPYGTGFQFNISESSQIRTAIQPESICQRRQQELTHKILTTQALYLQKLV